MARRSSLRTSRHWTSTATSSLSPSQRGRPSAPGPIILSTGSAYRELGLANEKRLSGHGVSWCATCDGFFFKDQDIAVIGGGDSAMEEALFLTKFAKSVTVVHRRDTLKASKIMGDRAQSHEKINFVWNTAVEDVLGNDKVTGLKLKNLLDGTESELP